MTREGKASFWQRHEFDGVGLCIPQVLGTCVTYTCSCLVTEAKQGVEWEEDTHQTTNTSLASARTLIYDP